MRHKQKSFYVADSRYNRAEMALRQAAIQLCAGLVTDERPAERVLRARFEKALIAYRHLRTAEKAWEAARVAAKETT